LTPGKSYDLIIEGERVTEGIADNDGTILVRSVISAEKTGRELFFSLTRHDP